MRPSSIYQLYHEDRLVRRWRDPKSKTTIFHGKRVRKDCPLTREEVRAYVERGVIAAVKLIRERGLSLREALLLLNKARGWSMTHV